MSEEATERATNVSYGEVLGEYLAVVNEISVLLDSNGRPDPAFMDEYEALTAKKNDLLAKLEQASTEENDSDIQAILDEAFQNYETSTS